ncbi:MAG: tetratricopeptide repeat protein [Chloroflexi bacterium]|nr:tetratricopeptide repeat protein [Chloroflexota bacterium]
MLVAGMAHLVVTLPVIRALPFGAVSRDRSAISDAGQSSLAAILGRMSSQGTENPLRSIREAELLWLCGQNQAALNELAGLAPRWDTASLEMGSILFQNGQREAAAMIWNQMSWQTKSSLLVPNFVQEGDIAFKTNRFADAVAFFQMVVSLDPDHSVAWKGLGDSLTRLRQWGDAEKAYVRTGTLVGLGESPIDNLVQYGDLLVRMDKVADGMTALQLSVRLDPSFAPAWTAYGNALTARGDVLEAGGAYAEAVRLDPDSPDANVSYGAWLLIQDSNDLLAEPYFERGIAQELSHPQNEDAGPWLFQKIVAAYWSVGHLESAITWNRRAMAQYPDHFVPYYMAGLTAMRQQEYGVAVQWLTQSLVRNDRNPDTHEALAEAYDHLQMSDQARVEREMARQLRGAARP